MDSDQDEVLMAETDEARLKERPQNSRCRSYGVPVALVAITVASCLMTLLTTIVYFNKDSSHDGHTHPPQYSAHKGVENLSLDRGNPVYAHKTLMFTDSEDTAETQASPRTQRLVIDPHNNTGPYEVSTGVTLLHQGLQIQQAGTYFVYKSIYFTHSSRLECQTLTVKDVTSYLMLNSTLNSGGITALLQSVHVCCPSCKDISDSAFSGGVFYFQERDIIQVEVMGEDSVDVERDITYVGLMKLGNLY